MNDRAAAVLATISAAFANRPKLSRDALVHDGTWETEDLIQALAVVDDVINEAFIASHPYSLPTFTAEGFRHVLPAYLAYSVRNPDSEATERVIFNLDPGDVTSPYWQDRLSIFTRAQKDAICAYIRYMQSALAGQFYDEYLERALRVWECRRDVFERD